MVYICFFLFTSLHLILYVSYCIFSSLSFSACCFYLDYFWDRVTFTLGFASSYFISLCGLVFSLRSFLWALFCALVFPEMTAILDFYKSCWHFFFKHSFNLLFDNLFLVIFLYLLFVFFFLFLVSCIDLVLFLFDHYSFSNEGCSSWIISVPGDW